VTTAPSRALVITGHDFRALLSQSPAIQLRILRSLAERMAPDLL
jgi:CRP-like cAMP-binding protein